MKEFFMLTAAPLIMCALCMLYVTIFERPAKSRREARR